MTLTPHEWIAMAGSCGALMVAAFWVIARLTRDTGRRAAPRHWDHIEDRWPSPGGWAGSMIHDAEQDYRARTGLLPLDEIAHEKYTPAIDHTMPIDPEFGRRATVYAANLRYRYGTLGDPGPAPFEQDFPAGDPAGYEGGWASGACEEPPDYTARWNEEDDPEDPGGPWLPAVPPAGPVTDVVDAALASAADDPADAGWTDQLLADLRDTPTCLDSGPGEPSAPGPAQPEPSRLADTGDIELISQRAAYAAELRAQDADAREFISRKASELAEFRLSELT